MKFTIRWAGGGYTVSIPNYAGGEVVTADEVERLERELKKQAADAHVFAVKHGLQNAEQMYPAAAICAQLSGELTSETEARRRGEKERDGIASMLDAIDAYKGRPLIERMEELIEDYTLITSGAISNAVLELERKLRRKAERERDAALAALRHARETLNDIADPRSQRDYEGSLERAYEDWALEELQRIDAVLGPAREGEAGQ